MKKVLSLAIAFIMICICSVTAFAQAQVFSVGGHTKSSELSISNNTASCTSFYYDADKITTKIMITQTLEKHSFLWAWETVGGTRTKTVNGSSASLTGKVSGLASGTYRVKTVFDVTANGTTETITVYSAEKTV